MWSIRRIGQEDAAILFAYLFVSLAAITCAVFWILEYRNVEKLLSSHESHFAPTGPEKSQNRSHANETQLEQLSDELLNQLAEQAPFGKLEPIAPTETSYESLPESELAVHLHGTFTHPDRNKASALLSVNGAPSRYVRVGDEITHEVTLYDVTSNGVILQTSAGHETVYFNHIKHGIMEMIPYELDEAEPPSRSDNNSSATPAAINPARSIKTSMEVRQALLDRLAAEQTP